jgi:hypothetical protein
MNTQRKRISIGLAEPINLTGAVKCGGVVVKGVKINPAANTQNTRVRTMQRMTMMPRSK